MCENLLLSSELVRISTDVRKAELVFFKSCRIIGLANAFQNLEMLKFNYSIEEISVASREAAFSCDTKVLAIFGGRWTSAPSLTRKIA